jgi:catechol 2,3-dioxygenase-like lactoylglutathione lyase family enzyme
MQAQLNHTIVWCQDKVRSAKFLAAILDRPPPTEYGPFQVLEMDNGVSLDFHETDAPIARQHYAFLIKDEAFDEVLARIKEQGITYWADPGKTGTNEINHNDGGRGCYFEDPDGHLLEVITRPYGSSSAR